MSAGPVIAWIETKEAMLHLQLQQEQAAQRRLTQSCHTAFRRVMEDRGFTYWKTPTQVDLLRWAQWSRFFEVQPRKLIAAVTDHYCRILRRGGRTRSLGINIATLSGRAAWAWVQEEFGKERTPVVPWSGGSRLRQVYSSLEDYRRAMYRHRILASRHRDTGMVYRGSPNWVRPDKTVAVSSLQSGSREDVILQWFGLKP